MDTKPFAKLFDTKNGQLLAYLTDSDDGSPSVRVVAAAVNGVVPAAILQYNESDEAEAAFAKIDLDGAEEFARTLRGAVAGMAS